MPVRAFSRVSKSNKNASQFSAMPRSSSKSASKPCAITPPSRIMAAGSGKMARCNNSAHAGGASSCLEICETKEPLTVFGVSLTSESLIKLASSRRICCLSCSDFCSVWINPTSSRGRTWRKAMRAVMRSTSLLPFSCWRSSCHALSVCKAAIVSSRCVAVVRSRNGFSNQLLSKRLPMPVMQVSSNENSVGESSPRRVCVNSKLRRVVGGKSIKASLFCTTMVCKCVRVWPCVCSAYATKALAAACACVSVSACQVLKLATLKSSSNLRCPKPASNCHSARRVRLNLVVPVC